MFRSRKPDVSVSLPRNILESIFDECDRHDVDETGGRLIGTYRKKGSRYGINVEGVIGPGPDSRRTATSFFQDGDYQEKIFRLIEESHPEIEHLGNWHTHHVNGFPTLSNGDRATYFKTVNHEHHNTDFFYALLVVRKNTSRDLRYDVNHYFLRRGYDDVYEIPKSHIRIVDGPILWPLKEEKTAISDCSSHSVGRVKDQEFFADFYPHLRSLFSKKLNALYWKGSVILVDGSQREFVVLEQVGNGNPSYSITCGSSEPILANISASYQERQFVSARHAVVSLERDLNRAMYAQRSNQ